MNNAIENGAFVGQSFERLENSALLRGVAHFIDDINPIPGIKHAAILRSPHGHAKIRRIDIQGAAALSGVIGILTGKEIAVLSKPIVNMITRDIDFFPCAVDKVRYFGEPVAIVVAESRYIAEDAIDLIEIDYEPLTAVVDIRTALSIESPALHERLKQNCVQERTFRYGNPEHAFESATHVVRCEVDYPRVNSTPIETYGLIAQFDTGSGDYVIWSNFQGPYALHPIMCEALKVRSNQLRLIAAPFSGGSFGIKHGIFPYMILCAIASRAFNVPVKWIEDRIEHLAGSSAASGRLTIVEGAFDGSGQLLGLRFEQNENVGAYVRVPEPAGQYRMHAAINGPYLVNNIFIRNRVVVTNQVPSGLNRGFGGPQFYYPLERMMDKAARQIGIDPVEIRRCNFIPADSFPYEGPAGAVFDSGDYDKTLQRALDMLGYVDLKKEYARRRADGRLCGIGLAVAIETSGSNMGYVSLAVPSELREKSLPKAGAGAAARITMDAGGSVTVHIDSVPAGQGHRTVVAQIVADELGLKPDVIKVVTALDTQDGIWSITSGNYANRFSTTVASSVALASRKAADKIRRAAAAELGVTPDLVVLSNGLATTPGNQNNAVPLRRIAGRLHWESSNLPEGVDGPISENATFSPDILGPPTHDDRLNSSLTYSFQCDLVALEIDRDTGEVHFDRYITVHDVGNILNPVLVEGQIRGGFVHGLGAAMTERVIYDKDGTLLTNTFQDYMCPTAPEIPKLEIGHISSPSPNTVHGSKGLGDGSSMIAPVAVANAVAEALGIEDLSPPFTPPRVWAMIHGNDPDEGLKKNTAQTSTYPGKVVDGAGVVVLSASPDAVWKALVDISSLKDVIPGCKAIDQIAPNLFDLTVDIRIAGIGGTYSGRIELSDLVEQRSLRLYGHATGALGGGEGHADVELTILEGGRTELAYSYKAGVTGKVVSFGHRMLNSVISLLINAFFEGLENRLGGNKDILSRLRSILRNAALLLRGMFA